jgi:hypothetical protein
MVTWIGGFGLPGRENRMSDDQSALRAYRDAASACEQARANTKKTIAVLGNALHAFNQYFEPFLVQAFDLPIQTKAGMPENYHLNLAEWPDATKLRQIVTAWHDAHMRMLEAWGQISDEDRQILKPPQERMSLG